MYVGNAVPLGNGSLAFDLLLYSHILSNRLLKREYIIKIQKGTSTKMYTPF